MPTSKTYRAGGSVTPAIWARAYRAMADELERIAAEQDAERRDWTSQEASPLGRRRHVKAVRGRIARGDTAAAMVGRRALLSAAALAEELAAVGSPKNDKCQNVANDLRSELGLCSVGGGRR